MVDSKVLIVSHDAGGAECLGAFVQSSDCPYTVMIYAEGPARSVFERRRLPLLQFRPVLSKGQYSFIITGSSMGSKLENQFVLEAKHNLIPTITLLDHWLHYTERFQNLGKTILPDKIWVTDQHAHKIATSLFPELIVEQKINWYWQEIQSKVTRAEDHTWLVALENRTHLGKSWRDSLMDACDWLETVESKKALIRLHPTMAGEATLKQIEQFIEPYYCMEIAEGSLVENLNQVCGVVGYQTTVLALASVIGKRAVSLVREPEMLSLPFEDIDLPFYSAI